LKLLHECLQEAHLCATEEIKEFMQLPAFVEVLKLDPIEENAEASVAFWKKVNDFVTDSNKCFKFLRERLMKMGIIVPQDGSNVPSDIDEAVNTLCKIYEMYQSYREFGFSDEQCELLRCGDSSRQLNRIAEILMEYSDSPRASLADRSQIREILGADHWIEATLMARHLDPTDYWQRFQRCIDTNGGHLYTFMQSLLWPFGTTFQSYLKEHETMVPCRPLEFTPDDLRQIRDTLVQRGKHNKMTRDFSGWFRKKTDRAESPDSGGVSPTLDM